MSPDMPAMTDERLAEIETCAENYNGILVGERPNSAIAQRNELLAEVKRLRDERTDLKARIEELDGLVEELEPEVERLRADNRALAEETRRQTKTASVEAERRAAAAAELAEATRLAGVYNAQAKMASDLLAERDKRLAEIGETTVEWAIRTDSADHAPDSPHFGSEQKVILNYSMDEQHARKHSKPWGWQAIHRIVGEWRDAEQEADRG